ncbi:MAG: hypothetical protein A3D35_00020 [Candidatus Staskawiczbacteria bacterium RIFCSPHIGHO2_02_FULL_34_9]|uniref:Bacterial type II secretion system protein E domain-containing protein n=1 Tax=Candidatus Staskawiczbacteria bacterium RIFCSPHIGHO2_02_FULL_34_9 TaxID=1802206 RepID=A0A1G2HY69_9BACT|nr:MAG: hypothetical protein A3D35_00020 [Candidatus Staskawiczbacteria bacterium RIFCSPHIGHO2_02_FULL_34_9]
MEETTKKRLLGLVTIPEEVIEDFSKNVQDIISLRKKIQEYLGKETTSLLSLILLGAIKLDASDIHVEPEEDKTKIRFRIDGILNDIIFFNNETYHSILSRIKLLSKIKLNITEKPQEGRFSVGVDGSVIEIRSSSLPSEYGESILMRILNPKNLMELDKLGLRKDLYDIMERQIKSPNGMIAVAGPTGSGKTTTLYAFLMKIKTSEIKIITIEDPIEYHLEGISQTQVNPQEGYTFSKGLVSIMRQDPDVILIGETRDAETAKISLQASLTGHLVLTTIHTNDAAGTIPRLKDLGTELSTIAPALKTIISQRLIRLVCKECSKISSPSQDEIHEIKRALKSLPKNVDIPKDLDKIKIAEASKEGCKNCNFTGYVGRKGIFEVAVIDAQIEKFILNTQPVSEIKELFVKKGMVTIYQSGLIEVILGNTTVEEIERVVGTEEKLAAKE